MSSRTLWIGVTVAFLGLLAGCGSKSTEQITSPTLPTDGGADTGATTSGDSATGPGDSSSSSDSSTAPDEGADSSPSADSSTDSAPSSDSSSTSDAPASDAAAYTVGGTITGLTGTVVLQDNGGDSLIVGGSGPFTFADALAPGASYAVTVFIQPVGEVCTVTSGTGTIATADVTTVAVTCTPIDGGSLDGGGGVDSSSTYTVGGTVVGLGAGDSVTLQDNGADSVTVSANGSFTFATKLPTGGAYAASVLTQPAAPISQKCVITNGTGTVGTSNVPGILVTCTTNLFTIGGTVTGLGSGSFVLQDNTGSSTPENLTISANGAFTFLTSVPSGGTYTVTILSQQTAGQTCTIMNGSGTAGAANVTNVDVVCTENTYTIGGSLTGLAATDTIVLEDNGGDDLTLNANGAFVFHTGIAAGQNYAVTIKTQPAAPAQTCVISSGMGTVVGSNVTSVVVNCATASFTVGGTMSGLSAGDSVALLDNGGDTLFVSANGSFSFPTPLASGAAYAVTVKSNPIVPIAETCVVAAGTGTVATANVTTVQVTCTINTYTIGGTVTGLAAGGSFVMLDNNTDSLTITGSTFKFAVALQSGKTWSVSGPTAAIVANQTTATSPIPQTCVVTANQTGTVGDANITNVGITCTTNKDCSTLFLADGNEMDPGDGDDYPSGVYNIDPTAAPGAGYPVYCDMTDLNGGWTLAAKINGNNPTTLQTWSYDQPIWTNATLLNATSTDVTTTEAKFESFLNVPFSNILVMMKGATSTTVVEVPLSDTTSLQHLFSSTPNTVTTSLGRAGWLGVTNPSASPQANCNREGVNVEVATTPTAYARVRLGLLTSTVATCATADSYVGFGGENQDHCYNQPYFGPDAGSAGGGSCGGGPDIANFGYIFVRP